jgi:hypothetical protein
MKLILGFLDRILFTLGVLVFMQLPHFVDQYTHRLGGYTRAAQEQLEQYRDIAQTNFNGDMDALIDDFRSSNNMAVAQTGQQVERMRSRAAQLQEGLEILESRSLGRKLVYLAAYLEPRMARDSLRAFKPGLPLTPEALVSGLAGGVFTALLLQSLIRLPGWFFAGLLKLRRRRG